MAAPAPQGPLRRRRRRVSLAVLGKRAVEVFRAEEEAGVAREVADRAAAVGGIRLEEALSREPAEVVEESREENARRRAEMVVLVEAEAEAALGQRTRAPVAPRAAAAACAFQSSGPTPSTRRRPHYGV